MDEQSAREFLQGLTLEEKVRLFELLMGIRDSKESTKSEP